MKNIFRKNLFILLFAFLIGLLYLSPQIYSMSRLGDDFAGVYRVVNDDEPYYMARAQDIVDGHYFLSNPFLFEYKNGQPMQFFLPDLLLAWPAKLFGIGVYPLYVFYDFLFPAIAFLLTFWIFALLIKNRYWSFFFSAWIFLIKYFWWFGRPVSPQFVFIPVLILTVVLLYLFRRKKINWWLVLLAGCIFGVLFHFYTYFWTFYLVLFGVWGLYFLTAKQWHNFKKVVLVVVIGGVIGVPYFVQLFGAARLPFFEESINRLGMLETRIPSGFSIVVPALVILFSFAVLLAKNKKNIKDVGVNFSFLVSGLLAAIVSVNSHIITGKNLFFSSHYELISYFFILFAFVYFLFQFFLIKTLSRFRFLKILSLIVLLIMFVPILRDKLDFNYQKEMNRQRLAPIFYWLNNNTAPDSVVMSDSEISGFVPSYTSNNVFFDPDAVLFFMPDEEILDRFVLNNFWYNFDSDFVKDSVRSVYGFQYDAQGGRAKQLNKLYGLIGKKQIDLDEIYYPVEKIEAIQNYHWRISVDNWPDLLAKYRIDYFIYDKQSDSLIIDQVKEMLSIQEVYSDDYFVIFAWK